MISFISITKTVFTSSGNYIPALSFRFETIINMTIRDRTIKRNQFILHPKVLSNKEV